MKILLPLLAKEESSGALPSEDNSTKSFLLPETTSVPPETWTWEEEEKSTILHKTIKTRIVKKFLG